MGDHGEPCGIGRGAPGRPSPGPAYTEVTRGTPVIHRSGARPPRPGPGQSHPHGASLRATVFPAWWPVFRLTMSARGGERTFACRSSQQQIAPCRGIGRVGIKNLDSMTSQTLCTQYVGTELHHWVPQSTCAGLPILTGESGPGPTARPHISRGVKADSRLRGTLIGCRSWRSSVAIPSQWKSSSPIWGVVPLR